MEESGRSLSLKILMSVTEQKAYNNISLNRAMADNLMPRERRAFVTECVNGTLRRLLTLDYIINFVADTKTGRMDITVLNLLRLSAYQLLFMDGEPDYAVCSEAIEIIVQNDKDQFKGFVNAVLRNIIRKQKEIFESIEYLKNRDRAGYFELKYSCPKDIITWLDGYIGEAQTEAFLDTVNAAPSVTACVNTIKTDGQALVKILKAEGAEASLGKTAHSVRIKGAPGIAAMKSFKDGLFHIMGESAMRAVYASDPKPGDRILDVCAAPGGKSFLSAYISGDKAYIESRDIHAHKIKLIRAGADRLGLKSIKTGIKDAAELNESDIGKWDVVLIDAPCSGLGLINKKPDIRYGFSGKAVSKLQGLQRRMINACNQYVRPGGTLIYSTCTLTPEENEKNAAWAVKTTGLRLLGEERILPQNNGSDGFYIAKFIRQGN